MPKYTYDYPKADITVDIAVFGISPNGELLILVIRRGEEPFKGKLALPGGFIEFLKGETAYEAARRELQEEVGLEVGHMEQLMTFDAPDRDPRGRTFSVAHLALVRATEHIPTAGSDASFAEWVRVKDILATSEEIAFDHKEIIHIAHRRLLAKVRYAPIGLGLLPKEFTLTQLQKLYETLLSKNLGDPSNFRKKIREQNKKHNFLKAVGVSKGGRKGPEARLYSFIPESYDKAVENGINLEF